MNQRDYLDVHASTDRATFERRLVDFAHRLDFEIASAAVAVDRPGQPAQFIMVGNTPQAFLEASRDPGNVRRDPVVNRMKRLSIPFIYDQSLYVSEGAGDLWELQAPFGYRNGIAMALHLPGGKHFLLGIDRSAALPADEEVQTRLIADVQLLAVYAQETAMRVLFDDDDPISAPIPRLTAKEREVLAWTRDGKSSWAVGQILAISEATVETHLRNIRRKLDTSSKHQAVLKAIALGLL